MVAFYIRTDTMFRQSRSACCYFSLLSMTFLMVTQITESLLLSSSRNRSATISAQVRTNATVGLSELKLTHDAEDSVLTDIQKIKLKEIRKCARLAGHEHPEAVTKFEADVCYKDGCLEAAHEVFSSMDFSSDPCDDWGKFACEWRTLTTKTSMDQHAALVSRAEEQVREILNDVNAYNNEHQLAQEYYQACIAWFEDFNKVDHITSYLETIGEWPLLTGKSSKENTWPGVLAEIIRIVPENVVPFVLKLEPIAVNESPNILIKIDSGSTSLEMDAEDIKLLLQVLRRKSSSSPEKDLEQIHAVQKCMKTLASVKFDGTDKPKVLTLADLQNKLTTEIPDLKFKIDALIKDVFKNTDVQISFETKVMTDLESFVKYIRSLHSFSPTTLTNLLFIQLTSLLLGDTTNILEEMNLLRMENYKRTISLYPSYHCIDESTDVFSHALSAEYIKRHYTAETTQTVNIIVESLKAGFINTVNSIKWLDRKVSDLIEDKVMEMEAVVGHPDWITDEKKVEAYYTNINLSVTGKTNGSKYLPFRTNALAWLNGKYWKIKLENGLVDAWNYKVQNGFAGDTSVEYIPSLNQLRIPSGVLQSPIFSNEYPGFMNFGGLGSIISRQLARILDLHGINTNPNGDIVMWLDEKSYKNYLDWTILLQRDWPKNDLSLNDKILSVFGYHITKRGYDDYMAKLKQKGKQELKLPGLSTLLPQKLLQLKYTNVFCEAHILRTIKMKTENSHPTFSVYSLFPISRNQQFAELFGCQLDGQFEAFDFL